MTTRAELLALADETEELETASCRECRFSRLVDWSDGKKYLACRRNPPIADYKTIWVTNNYVCGEFQPTAAALRAHAARMKE